MKIESAKNPYPDMKERLSAFLDGELQADYSETVIHHVHEESELKGTFARYQLIGHCIRGETISRNSLDVVSRVSASLQDEPTVLAPIQGNNRMTWLKPMLGTAIAATVAIVAVMLAIPQSSHLLPGVQTPGDLVSTTDPGERSPSLVNVTASGEDPGVLGAISKKEFDQYLREHKQFTDKQVVRGLLSSAKLVTYEGR